MYIEAALDSVLAQTYQHIELIIIDDCSSDSCPQIIEQWIKKNKLHCTYIQHEKNLGITKTSNEFVKLAKGKYLCLFATDDIMLPKKIERQTAVLEAAGEEYGMCYANVQLMDEAGNDIGIYDKENRSIEGDALEAFVFGDLQFATPSALIRMSVYAQSGLYDERVLLEDYNFWLRVLSLFKIKYCDYPCLIYRIKQQSAIYSAWTENNKERYYYDRVLSNFQALSYTKNEKVKKHLKQKITQYLKALSAADSVLFADLFKYLLKKGYYKLPYKTIVKRKALNLFAK
jgi:glycosyltransferase involved in cell wall biosynthesis